MNNIYLGASVPITGIIKHTSDEWSFQLAWNIDFLPGQFIIVSLPGFGEVPVAVSSCGNSTDSAEIMVRRVGKVTSGLFQLKVGDELRIRGPYGQGFPTEQLDGKHLLIIAGGSGVAAIKPLVEYYVQSPAQTLKELDILLGFRSNRHILYRKQIKRWARSAGVLVTVDSHVDDDEIWHGGIGFVVDFIKDVENIGSDTRVIVVGPAMMMNNCVRELFRHGVEQANIWLSFERHMKCGIGKCGHCRIKDKYVCLDGPVFNYVEAKSLID